MLGKFSCFCCRLLTFFQIILSGKVTISECQTEMDPDHDQRLLEGLMED